MAQINPRKLRLDKSYRESIPRPSGSFISEETLRRRRPYAGQPAWHASTYDRVRADDAAHYKAGHAFWIGRCGERLVFATYAWMVLGSARPDNRWVNIERVCQRPDALFQSWKHADHEEYEGDMFQRYQVESWEDIEFDPRFRGAILKDSWKLVAQELNKYWDSFCHGEQPEPVFTPRGISGSDEKDE